MERTIKITNAIDTLDAIEVSYDVHEGETIITSGMERFSHKSTKESIETHLQYILEKKVYQVVEPNSDPIAPIEVSISEKIEQLTGLEVKEKPNDNEK